MKKVYIYSVQIQMISKYFEPYSVESKDVASVDTKGQVYRFGL